MAQQPRRFVRPDVSTQVALEKERLLCEMKDELAKMSIVGKIGMPGGTVMTVTPEEALDHLMEEGCPHKIFELQNMMLNVEDILKAFFAICLVEQVVKTDAGCGNNPRHN